MRDVILVTADSVRRDYADAMEYVSSSLSIFTGVTAAHYTRPSLAALMTGSYQGAVQARAIQPTVADAFVDAGYSTIGLTASPHTDPRFGFDDGFDVYECYSEAGIRGTSIREFASLFDPIRKLYHRFRPPHAKLSNRLPNDELVDNAIEAFNAESTPRFVWFHMMGTHRPYGLGDDAVPKDIDRKALFAPDRLSADEMGIIEEKYRASLARADAEVQRFIESIDSVNPLIVFTSDHGDEFGEMGRYFHQPQRRRVADALTRVPVATNDFSLHEPLSLVDLGPTLLSAVGGEPPAEWHGRDVRSEPRDHALTIASWHGSATVAWQDFESKVIARDADVAFERGGESAVVEDAEIDEDLRRQMRDLGYVE